MRPPVGRGSLHCDAATTYSTLAQQQAAATQRQAPGTRARQANAGSIQQRTDSLNAQVTRAEHVHPLEPKARKHLDTPPPQAPHRNQLLDQFLVTCTDQAFGREFAAGELFREPADVLGFALREARCAQRGEVLGEDLSRGRERGMRVFEQRGEFLANRCRSSTGDLVHRQSCVPSILVCSHRNYLQVHILHCLNPRVLTTPHPLPTNTVWKFKTHLLSNNPTR